MCTRRMPPEGYAVTSAACSGYTEGVHGYTEGVYTGMYTASTQKSREKPRKAGKAKKSSQIPGNVEETRPQIYQASDSAFYTVFTVFSVFCVFSVFLTFQEISAGACPRAFRSRKSRKGAEKSRKDTFLDAFPDTLARSNAN